MLDRLKLPGSLFFVLCTFIGTGSAQPSKENKSIEREFKSGFLSKSSIAEQSPPNKHAKNYFNKKSVFKDSLPAENQDETAPTDWKLLRGDKEFAVEYGISPFNPSNFAGPKEFNVYGRDLHLPTLRFGRVIGTKKNVSYQYLFGVTPLAVFTKNEVVNPAFVSATATPNVAPTKRETTYGFGIQPVNFRFNFFAKNRLKPYAQVGAGILFTNKAVPVPSSTLFQMTGDFGGGLMYLLSKKRAVSIGYKYFHISNGNINGKINNPGFNANVFYINYSFLFR